MLTIIIITIISLIVGVIVYKTTREAIDMWVCLFFGISIGVLVSTILGSTNLSQKEVEYTIVRTKRIFSLNDNTYIQGRFTLGSGTIEGKICYVYYSGNDSIGFKIERILADNVIIKEDDSRIPSIVFKKYKRIKPFYKSFYIIPYLFDEDVIIYVPKGTIMQKYFLDSNLGL